MKKVIKFRGKRVDNGEFVYGHYATMNLTKTGGVENTDVIIFKNSFYAAYEGLDYFYEVIPETVGQFTGLLDKNGKEIYEGDIVREHCNDYTPIYQNAIYMAYNVDKINDPYVSTQFNVIWRNGCEVIGNIHDNPELINQ